MSRRADDSIPTRHSLLLRLKQWDDATGWREFFETYWELIYNVARKAGLNDAEAQEAVQETIVGLAKRIGEFKADRRHGSFKSWLLGQARWRIGDQFRARKRGAGLFWASPEAVQGGGELSENEATRTDPVHRVVDPNGDRFEGMWDEEWEQHVLRSALERVKAQVSVKQFQMFELHVCQGLTVGDTAKAVCTTRAAVYMAKSRVGRVLKREVRALRSE